MTEQSRQTDAGLFHAKKLSSLMREAGAVVGADQSLIYAAWRCVHSAWLSWLTEVMAFEDSQYGDVLSFEQIRERESRQNPDLVHLINLSLEPSSWVSLLLKHAVQPESGFSKAAHSSAVQVRNALTLVDVENETEVAVLQRVISDFRQHVQFTREQQQEW